MGLRLDSLISNEVTVLLTEFVNTDLLVKTGNFFRLTLVKRDCLVLK